MGLAAFVCFTEMYDCLREQQYIGRQMQSTRAVRERLDRLRSEHIQYALEVMAEPARPVKNVKAICAPCCSTRR